MLNKTDPISIHIGLSNDRSLSLFIKFFWFFTNKYGTMHSPVASHVQTYAKVIFDFSSSSSL